MSTKTKKVAVNGEALAMVKEELEAEVQACDLVRIDWKHLDEVMKRLLAEGHENELEAMGNDEEFAARLKSIMVESFAAEVEESLRLTLSLKYGKEDVAAV